MISASLDHLVHNGWSMDYQGLPPVDISLAVEPDIAVAALLPLLKPRAPGWAGRQPTPPPELPAVAGEKIPPLMLAAALREALGSRPTCLIRSPLAWANNTWDVAHPLDALGGDGGGGIGSGPGMAVGAALGLRDSAQGGSQGGGQGAGRLPVAVLGDGDFLMGATALWTAVHYGIPLLVVVSNNNSFFNDELHQDRMARQRNRPVANRWIGQRIADPNPIWACWRRRRAPRGSARSAGPTSCRARCAPRSIASNAAASRWSMCASNPATRRSIRPRPRAADRDRNRRIGIS